MIIKKLNKKEILGWISANIPDNVEVDLNMSQIFNKFQNEVYKHNLVPKKIVGSIKCLSCGKVHKATNIELLDLEHYVPPRGCTDGDYWEHEEYFILCEGCGHALTIPKEDRYKLPAMSAKKVNLDRGRYYLHRQCKIKYKTIYI
jgi:hypothetical protein